jgi:type IV pilus assembly protein PilC
MSRKLALAYHNLSVALEAGMPIFKSLNTIVEGQQGRFKRIFSDLASSISKGNSLAEAMAKHSNVFAHIDLMLVETGEATGNLAEVFRMLSGWYEFRDRIRKKILSRLMLPFVLIFFAAIVGPLPFFFLGKIGLGQYIGRVIGILALFYLPVGLILGVCFLMSKVAIFRRFLDALILRIPLFGQAVRQLAISRYCQAFNMHYKAGVPITQCAQKAANVTGNAVISGFFKGGTESARAGNMVCEGFSRRLPAEFLHLWQIGEETGELDKTVQKLASASGESAEFLFNELGQWLPRVIYWLVCIIIIIQILMIAAFITRQY